MGGGAAGCPLTLHIAGIHYCMYGVLSKSRVRTQSLHQLIAYMNVPGGAHVFIQYLLLSTVIMLSHSQAAHGAALAGFVPTHVPTP